MTGELIRLLAAAARSTVGTLLLVRIERMSADARAHAARLRRKEKAEMCNPLT